LGEIYQS
jgi:hypothetical protein